MNGEYRQLNDSLLQIENEYYATMRPKRVANQENGPVVHCRNNGVEYIEVSHWTLTPFCLSA